MAQGNEPGTPKGNARKARKCDIPARYVFVAVLTLGIFLNVILRTSLPISLTAMVRRNTSASSGVVDERDTCPAPSEQQNSTVTAASTGEFDWDEMTQTYVMSASSYGTLASTIVGARVAELWRTKHMFTICYIVSGVIYLLLPVTADWSVVAVIIFQALVGLVTGPMQPVMMSMCAAWFPSQERQLLYAALMSATSMGSIASSFLIGNLIGLIGWRAIFYLFSSIVLGWTILWVLFMYESPNDHPRISEEERIYITESTKKDEAQTVARLPWKEILLSPPVWAHIAMGLPSIWLNATVSTYIPTYMKNILHFDTAMIGNVNAISTICAWLSSVFFGYLSQTIRSKGYLSKLATYHVFNGISTIIPATLLIGLTFSGCDMWAVNFMITFVGISSGAYIGGSQLNQMDLAINYTGTIVGLSTTLYGVIGALAPLITGALTNNKQTLSAWNTVFYIAAGVKILPFFIFLFFGSVEEQPWNRVEKKEENDKLKSLDGEYRSTDKETLSSCP